MERRDVQNIELRLPVKQPTTIWIFYSFTQVNNQSDQWCTFSVYTLLSVGRGAVTVGVWSKKWGVLEDFRGVKYQCPSAMQTPIRQSDQIAEFYIFGPQHAAPCTMPPGSHAPICLLPATTAKYYFQSADCCLQDAEIL